MREYPWSEREIGIEHHRVVEAILERVDLYCAWVREADLPMQVLQRRGFDPELEAAWGWLDELAAGSIDSVPWLELWCRERIGSRTPEEALIQLGRAARARQALVLEQLLRRQEVQLSVLQDISRKIGANRGRLVASGAAPKSYSGAEARLAIIAACGFSWLDWPTPSTVVVERRSSGKIRWLRRACPHSDRLLEVGQVADALCTLEAAWIAGVWEALDASGGCESRGREGFSDCCTLEGWS